MTIQSGAGINFNSYTIRKPDNLSQKAIQDAQPKTLIDQIAKSEVKKNQTFQFKESVAHKEDEAMIKHVMQQLVAQATISHAAMIRNSHEPKGERKESAK